MRTTAIFAAAAMAAVPATAAAHPGNGASNGQGRAHGQGLTHRADQAQGGNRCARPQRVGFVARGTFVSFADDALVIKVVRANHHARPYVNGDPLSTKGAKVTFVGVTDGNADNSVGFDDAVATDRVMVIGKLVRPKHGCSGDTSVVLRKVMVIRPDQTADTPQAPEQD